MDLELFLDTICQSDPNSKSISTTYCYLQLVDLPGRIPSFNSGYTVHLVVLRAEASLWSISFMVEFCHPGVLCSRSTHI
jgi:hypothetical protein